MHNFYFTAGYSIVCETQSASSEVEPSDCITRLICGVWAGNRRITWFSYTRRIRYLPQRLINSALGGDHSLTRDYKLLIRNMPQLHSHSFLKCISSLSHPTPQNTLLTLPIRPRKHHPATVSFHQIAAILQTGLFSIFSPNWHPVESIYFECLTSLFTIFKSSFDIPLARVGCDSQTNNWGVILTEGCLSGCLIWQSALCGIYETETAPAAISLINIWQGLN